MSRFLLQTCLIQNLKQFNTQKQVKFKDFMQASKMTTDEIIFQPLRIKISQNFQQLIQKIAAISNRSYAIYKNFVVTWGLKAYKKQQGQSHQLQIIPIKLNELGLGSNHTFGYTVQTQSSQKDETQKAKVFCWGSNKNYQLGLQQEKYYGLNEVGIFDEALQAGFKLLEISCGDNHTLALLGDQQTGQTKLFGWGQSKSYQLALDTTSIVPYPVDIEYEFTSFINKIYSKSDYNIAITNDGEMYSWGSNLFNRLGVNVCKISKNSPTQANQLRSDSIENFKKRQQDRISQRRSSFIQSSTTNVQKVKVPRQIALDSIKIRSIALGTYHVLALSVEGSCLTWGNGIYGQLGNNKYGQCSPQLISINHLPNYIKFIGCSAGQHHSCLLDTQGNLYSCGSNSYGVLGHQKHQNQTKKKRCKIFEHVNFFSQNHIKITQIVSGDRHCLALSSTLQLYGWGSNKFNQIAIPHLQRQKQNLDSCVSSIQFIPQNFSQSIYQEQNDMNHLKFSKNQRKQEFLRHQQNSNLQLKSLQLLNEKQMFSNNKFQWKKLIQWKKRYTDFLIKKRKQEDMLMQELNQLISQSHENR